MENESCLICGRPLVYLETAEEMTCEICKKPFTSHARCTEGHYVCDACHANPAITVSTYECLHTTSKNPIEIAETIMKNTAVHMHGPEHHVIVGQALLAAYQNAGGNIELATGLTAVAQRGKMVPGGFCGLAGNCGAAVSAGIFLSTALKTNPLSEETWALGMKLTAECLSAIANYGGPRCCKRDSFTSILTAAKFAAEHLAIKMELPEKIVCRFSAGNNECLKEKCPYYPLL